MTTHAALGHSREATQLGAERPYPLRRRFLLFVLPTISIALVVLLVVVGHAITQSVERFYEGSTVRRHERFVTSVASVAPSLTGREAAEVLEQEARHSNLQCLAILRLTGEVLSESGRCPTLGSEELGFLATGRSLFRASSSAGVRWIVASRTQRTPTRPPLIVLSARAAVGAERVVSRAALGWVVGLGAAIVAGLACATVLAWRAQDEINRRTVALAKTREALAPFISRHARARAANGPSSAQRLTVTVLFLDIRDFSTFADTSTPEDAAALVSTVASVAFAAVLRFDGDVDRLVGDGMVARFDGTDRRDRAWQSALTIMQELARLSLPRLVSLSLHDGVVIEATIGGQARADATILGRTVNIGSRLCSEAAPAELVVTDAMVPMPDGLTLRARGTDVMYLKGHREPFAVHRFGFGPTRAGATTQSRRQREATSLRECIAS